MGGSPKWRSDAYRVMARDSDPGGVDGPEGLQEGVSSSQGDPRVLVALNAILSFLFAWMVVWGASLIGIVEYGWTTIAVATVGLFLLTYVVTLT